MILSNKTFGGVLKISRKILKITQMHALNLARLRQNYKWKIISAKTTSLCKTLSAKLASDTMINQAPVDFMTPKERIAHSMILTMVVMGPLKPTRLAVHARPKIVPNFAVILITEPTLKCFVSYFKDPTSS